MTQPAILNLTLTEIRLPGRDARQFLLPSHCNPFHLLIDLDLEAWAGVYSDWPDWRVEKYASRTGSLKNLTLARLR